MVPITCSCRARCRMFSSCLTYFVVSPSYSVRRPAVPSSFRRLPRCLLACLVSSCHLARFASLLASLLVGRDGSAMGVGSVCDYGGRADAVRISCGCLLFGSPCSPSAYRPASRHGWRGGERRSSLLASFGFLPSTALVSCWDWSACLSLCRRSDFSCDARILWIAFLTVAGAASQWYIVIVS